MKTPLQLTNKDKRAEKGNDSLLSLTGGTGLKGEIALTGR